MKKNTGLILFVSLISFITVAGLLSFSLNFFDKENVSSELNDKNSNSINNDENLESLNGWHHVTSVEELSDGDKITFLTKDKNRAVKSYNESVKRFEIVDSTYSVSDRSISNDFGEAEIFELGISDDGYTIKCNDLYLTSAYSSGNTCKLTNVLNEYSTFSITFEDGFAICKSGGDKKCNTIKFSSSYFSLYTFDSGDFPYLMKWYGDSEAVIDSSFNPEEFDYQINLDEWDMILYEDQLFNLEDGMEFIPLCYVNDKYYIPYSFADNCFDCNEYILHDNKLYGHDPIKSICSNKDDSYEDFYRLSIDDTSIPISDTQCLFKTIDGYLNGYYEESLTTPYNVGFGYREDSSIYQFGVSPYFDSLEIELIDITYILVKKTTE